MNEKQLAKLIRKTTEKAEKSISRQRPARAYDPTLKNRDEDHDAIESGKLFDEMKRREF